MRRVLGAQGKGMTLNVSRAAPFRLSTARQLGDAAFDADPSLVQACRLEIAARPLPYPYGSGQAEEIALLLGLKPVVRQLIRSEDIEAVRRRFEALGLLTETGEGRMNDKRFDAKVLHVGRDRGRLQASLACDVQGEDTEARLGELLGYPPCCVQAFVALPAPRRNMDLIERALRRTTGGARSRLNMLDLGMFHFISWIPCALDCAASAAWADAVAEHMRCKDGQGRFVADIDLALGAARLVLLEGVQLSLRGRWQGAELHIDALWPTARDRHPRAALSPEDAEATARALAWLRGAERVAVHDGVLHVDGEARLRSSELMLVAFGQGVMPELACGSANV